MPTPGCVAIALCLSALALSACTGLNPPAPVSPLPTNATGLPIFLAPEPNVVALDDAVGRPLTVALEHAVRDVLEEAGFKLVDSEDAAGGLIATLTIQRAGAIHADVFIHGAEACGVKLDIKREGALVAAGEPEAPCASTSTYYGVLAKDAAIEMINAALRAPAFVALTKSWHAPPASKASASALHTEEPTK
jgi:hypothetical protein